MHFAISSDVFWVVWGKKQRAMGRQLLLVCVVSVMSLVGCAPPPSEEMLLVDLVNPYPAGGVQGYVAGRSVEGRPVECLILGQGRDVTFILSTIHGDEPAGTPLVQRLAEYLQQQPQLLTGRKIVLVPTANPDGVAYKSRYNVRGIDLNRNFPAANRINNARYGQTMVSEPEARIIKRIIEQYSPARIVSVHQPLACIDYDGPGQALADRMAEHCNLPVRKLGARPGSLGSYAGLMLGIPIITVELLAEDSNLSSQQLWQRYGRMLVAAVIYPDRVIAK